MKYKDLIQFDPIESVIQLRDANQPTEAANLVGSFVISPKMSDRLSGVIIPQLQFEKLSDNRGLLIVGNYGTGKSHLMSLISSLAEHADLSEKVKDAKVKEAAKVIAGRFQVLRTEIGSTTMDFRQFVVSEIERALKAWGVKYKFPARDQLPNHKGAFEDMMAAFHEKFPDHGFLMVVDELLDYLSTRKDEELLLDLGFLRELGEVTKNLRFRFIAGLQEMLFDSPRFRHVSQPLRRVKDRFEQVLIEKSDVEFVVQERLLGKSPQQLGQVEEHLKKYTKCFPEMSAKLDRYVTMFPVHPDYVGTFERMAVGEKREVLKSLTGLMNKVLADEVPGDDPGVISYDRYWEVLVQNPSLRSLSDDIKKVVDTSKILEDIVARNLKPKTYLPMAKRVIHALAVHRLTTDGIDKPIGMTADALRDSLCLYDKEAMDMGGEPSEDLLAHVETVLRAVIKSVAGQFITYRKDTQQYFLDVHKTEDYEGKIEERADGIGDILLNRAYHSALKVALECDDQTYVSGARIWLHELEWRERKVGRQGYLFFGSPSERSTAQPPREFYLYFLQPFDPPKKNWKEQSDEVFFKLVKRDEDFDRTCALYAAAYELHGTASGDAKKRYNDKAEDYLRSLVRWIQNNIATAYQVIHQGSGKKLSEWIRGVPNQSLLTTVNQVGSACLASQFQAKGPDHPVFNILITSKNRSQACQEAIRWIRGVKTTQGAAVLDGLELLQGNELDPSKSRYAQFILKKLTEKPHGQVVNRAELIETIADHFEKIELLDPKGLRLEPEFVAVLLVALVYNGDIVVSVVGEKYDSGKLDAMASSSLDQLTDFKHIERPKDWDTPSLRELFKLLGLPPGLIQLVQQNKKESIEQLHKKVDEFIQKLVTVSQSISNGFIFWSQPLKSESELEKMATAVASAKSFLESLQAYNTPGKLKNFRSTPEEIMSKKAGLDVIADVEALENLVSALSDFATYLSQAEMALASLPDDHHWKVTAANTKKLVFSDLKDPKKRAEQGFQRSVRLQLQELKDSYIQEYRALHDRARLSSSDDKKKGQLINDPRREALKTLTVIEHLPTSQFRAFDEALTSLKTCFALTDADLKSSPICPHCHFNPASTDPKAQSASMALSGLDTQLDAMLDSWTALLLEMLDDPATSSKLKLLSEERRKLVKEFTNKKELPQPLTADFVQAIKEALSDLSRVAIKGDDLKKALAPDTAAVKLDDLRSRFEKFLVEKTKGMETDKVRVVIE